MRSGSLFLFVLFSCIRVVAQQYGFINYSVEDGLAQSQVNSIAQDKKGYLWFATGGGVSRFDGKSFVNYYTGDGLLDNKVNSVFVDSDGKIWLATIGGLNLVEGKNILPFKFKGEFQDHIVKSITEDKKGYLWLGTNLGAVVRFEKIGRRFEYFNKKNGLSDDAVRSLVVDDSGVLWVGRRHGLCFLEKDSFKNATFIDPATNISSLAYNNGVLRICTLGDGVYIYDGRSTRHYNVQDGLIDDWIRSVTVDREGNCWFSSIEGLCKYDGKTFLTFNNAHGLENRNINVTFEDSEGNLWLGSEGSGLYRFCGEAFVNYTVQDGLPTNAVMAIVKGNNNEIWLGTYGEGIVKKEGNKFSPFSIPGGTSQNYVYSCLYDTQDQLWLGTGEGLYKYDGKELKNFGENVDLKARNVICVFRDSKQSIWVCTLSGLFRYDGERFVQFEQKKFTNANIVSDIYEDKNSTLWFACTDGIKSFDGKVLVEYTYIGEQKIGDVLNISEDKTNNLWFGTSSGLIVYDKKDFKKVSLSDDFSSNQINSLVVDENNILWAGTNNGIYFFDVTEYTKNKKISIRHMGSAQGLKSIECNQNSIYNDIGGSLFVGTTGGLVELRKNNFSKNIFTGPPVLNITNVRLFLQETDWSFFSDSVDENSDLPIGLSVDYKKNHLTFDFIGITFSNPENIRYKFKLIGNDEDWYPATKETFATYSNLSYGEYKFVVALTDERGAFLDVDPVEFSFVIRPPYWKTWWFTIVCFAFTVGVALMIYRWRWAVIKRKREAQQLVYKSKLLALEQETLNASLNRHFIFNALNSIQYYINRQDKLAANKYLSSFAKLIRKNLDSSQNNLVTLSEELERLELYLGLEHMRFSKFSYSIKIGPGIEPESLKIPPMILQPYVENSIWHGILPMDKDGQIIIEIKQYDEKSIVFIIEDNGIGIDASLQKKQQFPTEHDSKGMKITETRINLLRKMTGGNIEIKGPYDIKNEGKGTGTRVEIILPVKK